MKIGKNIKSIAVDPTISGKHSISSIKVESGNKYFYVKDGILFSKDKTKLILYPNMRKNTTYTVPSGVKVIGEYAFAGANIKNVTISSKVSEIGKNAFENCKSLEKVQGEFNTSELPENLFYDCTKLNYFVIFIIFIIIKTLIFNDPTSGWPSLVCIITLIGGIQIFCVGIVGEYLSKIYLETKNRPVYIGKEDNLK